jgi:long-chain fatty acid transport protein
VGAGFIWGVALIEFVNFTEAVSPPPAAGQLATDDFASHLDVKARLNAKDLFIPGFVLGGLWSPARNVDVGAWVKWMDAVRSKGDLHAESLYWTPGGQKNDDPCNVKDADPTNDSPAGATCNITDAEGVGDLLFRLPMEAKLGVRYHHPRPGTALPAWASRAEKPVRDPMTDDLFDVEMDFTYAHNSVVDDLELHFQPGIKINGTPGEAPADSSVTHNWKDVFGVRLGGDFVAIPGKLAVRAGGFFESKGQDDEYLNIDFDMGMRVGVGGGATVRLGPVDVSLAYQHTFFGDLDNGGKGALKAISGDQAPDLQPPNRSRQSVNGGKLTTSLNEVGLAGTFHF